MNTYGTVTDIFGCIRKDTCLRAFRYHLLRLDTYEHLQIRICYAPDTHLLSLY